MTNKYKVGQRLISNRGTVTISSIRNGYIYVNGDYDAAYSYAEADMHCDILRDKE